MKNVNGPGCLVLFVVAVLTMAVMATSALAFEVENAYGSVDTGVNFSDLSTDTVDNLGLNLEFKGSLVESDKGALGVILRGATETGHGFESALDLADKTAGAYVRFNILSVPLELQVTHTNYGLTGHNEDRAVLYFGKITSW
ncbi:hypothetical protein KAR91_11765 [Candidatus Pacearchaeota archaeon]|nr:hypothetical protein [Candidatus Pacearchaeota archaeon]